MSEVNLLDILRKMEFLRNLKDDHLEQLAAISKTVEYPTDSIIFRENDLAKDVYFIVHGHVSLVNCLPSVGCRQMLQASDGDLLGWSPLVHRPRLSATAHATSPTVVLVFDGERLLQLCKEVPELGLEILRRTATILSDRLSATRLQMLNMTGHSLPEVVLESD